MLKLLKIFWLKARYLHKIKTGEQTLILADLYAAGNALYEENTNDSYTGHENIRTIYVYMNSHSKLGNAFWWLAYTLPGLDLGLWLQRVSVDYGESYYFSLGVITFFLVLIISSKTDTVRKKAKFRENVKHLANETKYKICLIIKVAFR